MLEITCCAICVWVGNGATSFDIDHPGSSSGHMLHNAGLRPVTSAANEGSHEGS